MKRFAFSQVQLLRTADRHLYTKQHFILQPSLILRSNKDGKRGMEQLRLCTLGCSPGCSFREVHSKAVLLAYEAYLSRNFSRLKCLQEAICRL